MPTGVYERKPRGPKPPIRKFRVPRKNQTTIDVIPSEVVICDCGESYKPRGAHAHLSSKTHRAYQASLAPDVEHFPTGAKRHKLSAGRIDLTPTEGLIALGETNALGAGEFGLWNWSSGMPYYDIIQHMSIHMFDLAAQLSGGPVRPECTDTPRRNAAAIAWGAFAIIHFLHFGNPAEES